MYIVPEGRTAQSAGDQAAGVCTRQAFCGSARAARRPGAR